MATVHTPGRKPLVIVSREEWGALPPKWNYTKLPVDKGGKVIPVNEVIIHHTAGETGSTPAQCTSLVSGIQNFHMNTRRWNDIGYNFLIGGDGRIYEGRGWDNQGSHASGHNNKSIGISFLGEFTEANPSDKAKNQAKMLIEDGQARGKIKVGYKLMGHRDVAKTTCPGDKLYRWVKEGF